MKDLTILSGGANPDLAEAVATRLGVRPVARTLERFPDSELHVDIEKSVRGKHVFLIQPTSPPVDTNLFEVLFLADACRRSGAERLTAVIPYFGYARQDKRSRGREAIGGRLAAELVQSARFERVVSVDLHTPALEGFFAIPVEHLTAVPILAEALRESVLENAVVVAPDLGAAKLAERYAALLRLPVALVHKTRLSGEHVAVRRVTGEVRNRSPLIIDDMITTGGTIEAASRALLEAGCRPEITVAATHGLFVGPAAARLDALPIPRLVVTDTVATPAVRPRSLEIVPVSDMLADALARLGSGRSLADLAARG